MTKLSRSKLELFTDCKKCFWLDMRQGIKRPPPMPYTINSAIDYLLKQEFDIHREACTPHPIMEKHKIDAVPFRHENMNKWRHNFTGVQYEHKPTDFLVYGAVDDIWINPGGELHVVDYKATGANQHNVYDSYRRQMEIYQWLLRQNGFRVSPVGYFVFARVSKAGGFAASAEAADEGGAMASLDFDIFVEPLEGNGDWIESALAGARNIFDEEHAPPAASDCKYCGYRSAAAEF